MESLSTIDKESIIRFNKCRIAKKIKSDIITEFLNMSANLGFTTVEINNIKSLESNFQIYKIISLLQTNKEAIDAFIELIRFHQLDLFNEIFTSTMT